MRRLREVEPRARHRFSWSRGDLPSLFPLFCFHFSTFFLWRRRLLSVARRCIGFKPPVTEFTGSKFVACHLACFVFMLCCVRCPPILCPIRILILILFWPNRFRTSQQTTYKTPAPVSSVHIHFFISFLLFYCFLLQQLTNNTTRHNSLFLFIPNHHHLSHPSSLPLFRYSFSSALLFILKALEFLFLPSFANAVFVAHLVKICCGSTLNHLSKTKTTVSRFFQFLLFVVDRHQHHHHYHRLYHCHPNSGAV